MMACRRQTNESLALVKLGGSVLLTRGDPPVFRHEVARRLAEEIKAAELPTIVLHGTGMLTKRLISDENACSDFINANRRDLAVRFWLAGASVTWAVWRAFLEAGCPAVSVPPLPLFRCRAGCLEILTIKPLHDCLHRGLLPLVHGNILPDEARGFYACSSDYMLAALAQKLRPSTIVFVMDVDGIYLRYPPPPGQDFLKRVDAATHGRLDTSGWNESTVGGVHGKLRHALACAPFCQRCLIINGLVPGRLHEALRGQTVVGTEVGR